MNPTDSTPSPDLVVSEEALHRAEEFVEADEGATNQLKGWLGIFVVAVAFVMSAFHLYTAYGKIKNKNGAGYTVANNTESGTGDSAFNLGVRHRDCGCEMFSAEQDVDCGASGCGCAASFLNGYYLKRMTYGEIHKILLVATGALLSPTSAMQGESIPSVAHAVAIEM